MFLAMNRFYVARGKEEAFVEQWRNRNSYLEQMPGFRGFSLLRGPSRDDHTLFVSHSGWDSEAAFGEWTRSEAFGKAHGAAGASLREVYVEPPCLEIFQSVLNSEPKQEKHYG